MDAESHLRKYMRPVPGGAIAWRRSIFLEPAPYTACELIDLAVDIAWEILKNSSTSDQWFLEVRKSGSYLVFFSPDF